MASKLSFTGIIKIVGVLGAFGVSLLFALWTWRYQPSLFNDGQAGMIFAFTSFLGWLIGSIIGSALAMYRAGTIKPQNPFRACLRVVLIGTLVVPIPGMLFMMVFFACIGVITGAARH